MRKRTRARSHNTRQRLRIAAGKVERIHAICKRANERNQKTCILSRRESRVLMRRMLGACKAEA
eukprot:1742221-Pleurochrysis_carterae.AAC.1